MTSSTKLDLQAITLGAKHLREAHIKWRSVLTACVLTERSLEANSTSTPTIAGLPQQLVERLEDLESEKAAIRATLAALRQEQSRQHRCALDDFLRLLDAKARPTEAGGGIACTLPDEHHYDKALIVYEVSGMSFNKQGEFSSAIINYSDARSPNCRTTDMIFWCDGKVVFEEDSL